MGVFLLWFKFNFIIYSFLIRLDVKYPRFEHYFLQKNYKLKLFNNVKINDTRFYYCLYCVEYFGSATSGRPGIYRIYTEIC